MIGNFYKAKAAALVGLLVQSDAGADHLTDWLHQFGQVGGGGSERQIAKIEYFAHDP
jgi:hypothetical protein